VPVREVRPRWLLIENVPNLRTKGADAVLTSLEEEGYTCWPFVVGAWSVAAKPKGPESGSSQQESTDSIAANTEGLRIQRMRPAGLSIPTALVQAEISGGRDKGALRNTSSQRLPDWAGGTWNNPSHSRNLNDQMAQQKNGKLSTIFVEWLMGYPTGWTALSRSATK
jgi:hypothetical protein